jgi:epoxyqueuosine reductase
MRQTSSCEALQNLQHETPIDDKRKSNLRTDRHTSNGGSAVTHSTEVSQPPMRASFDPIALKRDIRVWAAELGFGAVGVSDTDLGAAELRLLEWLAKGFHGDMEYLERHGTRRSRPGELVPGTVRVISARLDYLPAQAQAAERILSDDTRAYVARYAVGRDYHKVLRSRLQRLAERIEQEIGEFRYRVFTDSAPVLEVELAVKAGLGWRGKHTLLLQREAGSWFFLGEIYTDLPLPVDSPEEEHCGTCSRCIDICPTGAIVAPYQLDARRCISYLTIEHHGSIPVELRSMLGNRIYGCDDCQLVCPWNRFARPAELTDFSPRHGLDQAALVDLFAWTAEEFEQRLQGSAIRRIGHERWLRNLAVAMGNASADTAILEALRARADHPSGLVREHVQWAIAEQERKLAGED